MNDDTYVANHMSFEWLINTPCFMLPVYMAVMFITIMGGVKIMRWFLLRRR